MPTIIRTIAIAFLIATLCYLSTACGNVDTMPAPAPASGTQGALCGFHGDTDHGQCNAGLECFGVCTFECGARYHCVANCPGEFGYAKAANLTPTRTEYGVDQPSVDRCAAVGGSCEQYAPGVAINVCKTAESFAQ